jgi:hypothetical protein
MSLVDDHEQGPSEARARFVHRIPSSGFTATSRAGRFPREGGTTPTIEFADAASRA